MTRTSFFVLLCAALLTSPASAWRLEITHAPGKVSEIETIDNEVRVATDHGWFRAFVAGNGVTFEPAPPPRHPPIPKGALPDGRIVGGKNDIARAWLASPTRRYDHGVLGDAVEAGALVIESRDERTHTVMLGEDAVFEDLRPRIADLGDGRDSVIVVKSYLKYGSTLAVIGKRDGRYAILAETPVISTRHRWLNPAGIADFDGDGAVDIALVKMPHAVGRLELWSWRAGRLQQTAKVGNTSNHSIGSRALNKSAVADFDGDGKPDLAIPSFDERSVRLIAFAPHVRDIARLALPARPSTDFGLLRDAGGRPVVLVGLDDGRLVAVRQ
jgi:hypothetical protein